MASTRAAIAVIALSLMAFFFLHASADAAPCAEILRRYQSGAAPHTLSPLRRHSALYLSRKSDGSCGYGSGNNYATAQEARAATYRTCMSFPKNAAVGCTLVGLDGRVLAGAKRIVPDFVITATNPPKARVAQPPSGEKFLPGEPRIIGFTRPVKIHGVSCSWHPADADRRQCEETYCYRPAKEGRPMNPYWCSHLKPSARSSR
jgi:hypothetical protein